jgi:hypothetical protein
MNKYQRRAASLVARGRCPHCGKPCAPYYECGERRLYKKINYHLRRGVQFGTYRKEPGPDGKPRYFIADNSVEVPGKKCDDPNDTRALPRINDKPIDSCDLVVSVLHPGGMTEEQIATSIGQRRAREGKRFVRRLASEASAEAKPKP